MTRIPLNTTSLPIADHLAREAALAWLMGRINYERTASIPYQDRQLKLDRMRQLLTRLGQPDAGLRIIHVAGTKGKGSTSAMVAAILTAAGFRTGLFTSPHLERIEERFMVDGKPCTATELVALVDQMRPIVRAMDEETDAEAVGHTEAGHAMARKNIAPGGPTFFDITTAMALLHFVERQVDAVVLEVGLGGRLDSTNVCLPTVSVITSIGFDHMRQLGDTLAAIAREKAGIIKPGVPVISGVLQREPKSVIENVAREHGCRLLQLGREFDYQYSPPASGRTLGAVDFHFHVPSQSFHLRDIKLGMPGPHQAANAAVALATLAELRHQGWCVSSEAMRIGLSRAVLPGRVEIVPGEPTVVIDTAHNPASAQALVEALAEMPTPSRHTLVLSISRDKDVRSIVRTLGPHFDRFVITEYLENPRAVPAESLASCLRETQGDSVDIVLCPTPREAWQFVRQSAIPRERISIAGSFYLAAEMRSLVLNAAESP